MVVPPACPQQLLYRPDVNLMARDSNGESPTQVAMRLLKEAEAAREAQESGAELMDTSGPEMVLDYLRRKANLERAMNAGRIKE